MYPLNFGFMRNYVMSEPAGVALPVLYAWGANAQNQLGDGSTISRSSPIAVSSLSNIVKVVGGGQETSLNPTRHAAALDADGNLFVWGRNTYGQLGLGNTLNRSVPTQVPGRWRDVDVGQHHTVAIRVDGTLWTWGYNQSGQLGLNNQIYRSSPVQVGTSSWVAVAASDVATHAIRADATRTVWSWGANNYGQIGNGFALPVSTPTQVSSLTNAEQISAGPYHVFVRLGDGTLRAWGEGEFSLGIGSSFTNRSAPVTVSTGRSFRTMVACYGGGFAIDTNDKLFAWGSNSNGRLGNGTTSAFSVPQQVGTLSWADVTGTQLYTAGSSAGITTDGNLFTWGEGTVGEQGSGATTDRSVPTQVGTRKWANTFGGAFAMYATPQAQVFGWGPNQSYQLNDGTTVSRSSPVLVSGLTNVVKSSGAGSGPTTGVNAALDVYGNLFMWGNNDLGQLGLGDTIYRSTPVQVPGRWRDIAASAEFTAAIRSNGTMWAWGSNAIGQLGLNDTINRSSPVQIGTNRWLSVTATGSFASALLAIRFDGTLWAWGNNANGALGVGDKVARSSPVQTGSGELYLSVSANNNVLAVRTNNTLWAWGNGANGINGDGTTVSRSNPVQVGSRLYTAVSSGSVSNAAIDVDSKLWAWGSNGNGELGDGTTITRTTPVSVTNLNWRQVAFQRDMAVSAAITTDGKLYTWGTGGGDTLGDGSTISRSSPMQVGTDTWSGIQQIYRGFYGMRQ